MTRVIERMPEYYDASWRFASPPPPPDKDSLPSLYRDRAFWGMTVTQFLGAFNDSVFKQIVLLLCTQVVVAGAVLKPQDHQWLAQGVFAISFVIFSGIAGYWADRYSKRFIVVASKVAEITVMLAAVAAFVWMAPRLAVQVSFTQHGVVLQPEIPAHAHPQGVSVLGDFRVAGEDRQLSDVKPQFRQGVAFLGHPTGETIRTVRWGDVTLEGNKPQVHVTQGIPWLVLLVLFFMGAQSAVFGPAKYGILPEMVRQRDLPRFNGVIQMTTFLALIFGIMLGGYLLDKFTVDLWMAAVVCVGIAALGTATSFLVRRTPVAQPDARFQLSAVAVAPDTWDMLRCDRSLMAALIVYSLFWFVAAVIPMSINALGINVLERSAFDTSLMLGAISIGIAIGCLLAGKLSAERVRFGLVRLGAWGMLLCLVLLSLPGIPGRWLVGMAPELAARVPSVNAAHLLGYWGSQATLAVAGLFAGLVAVPLQVYLQAQPPDALKGRMIGTMNLVNWVLILLSAGFYFGCQIGLEWLHWPTFLTFGATALILAPIALFYRPTDVKLT